MGKCRLLQLTVATGLWLAVAQGCDFSIWPTYPAIQSQMRYNVQRESSYIPIKGIKRNISIAEVQRELPRAQMYQI